MAGKLSKSDYQKLIDEDIIWLKNHKESLERDHLILVAQDSVEAYYPENNFNFSHDAKCNCFVCRIGGCRK